MKKSVTNMENYLDASRVFHWAYMRHYVWWFMGNVRRHQRTEKILNRLVKNGKLKTHVYGRKIIYGKKTGLINEQVPHGLACTECLVRMYRSKPDGVAIPEKYFRGIGSVPEWGIIYPDGKLLLFEFCTKNNFYYSGNMRGKLAAYRRCLHKIEEKFNARALVVFVLEIPRGVVERYVGSVRDAAGSVADGEQSALHNGDTFPDPFFFTDYETFLKVPFGQAIEASIYFWVDGKEYSLNGR